MRQAPFGVLHSLSIRLTTHKRLDARVHLGPQIADCMCMQAGKGPPSVVHASGPVL